MYKRLIKRFEQIAITDQPGHATQASCPFLPAIGSRLINSCGIEFVVDGHIYVPSPLRSRVAADDVAPDPRDFYPSIIPQNLSEKLTSFIGAVDRCTAKKFILLDAMPHARAGEIMPGGYWIDTVSNQGTNLIYVDAAHMNETHLAHEVCHAWVQYVEEAEDERVMKDMSDPQRVHQFNFVQSFVLDLWVNEILSEKGFDVSIIKNDQAASVESLIRVLRAGYKPESRREAVFMALALAAQMLEGDNASSNAVVRVDGYVLEMKELDPQLADLATRFAAAVRNNGYRDRQSVRTSIDECLQAAFNFSGDPLDLGNDLITPPCAEPDGDKYPNWFAGTSPSFKRAIARIMAREGVPGSYRWSIGNVSDGKTSVSFESPHGASFGPWIIDQPFPFTDPKSESLRINAINRRNIEKHMPNSPKPNDTGFFPHGHPGRPYMAGAARFLTAVREEQWLGGENPKGCANGNPILYTDPSGNAPLPKRDQFCDPIPCIQYLGWVAQYFNQYCAAKCPNLNMKTLMCQISQESSCHPCGPPTEGNYGLFQISYSVWFDSCRHQMSWENTKCDAQTNIRCAMMAMCNNAGLPYHCDKQSTVKKNQLTWGTDTGPGTEFYKCMHCDLIVPT